MTTRKEEDLDPKNWDEVKLIGQTMIDDMVDYLSNIHDEKTWVDPPEDVIGFFATDVPKEETELEEVYRQFRNYILPYNEGTVSPRFWGWVEGTGTVVGMFAEMLKAGMNVNAAGGRHSATYAETEVIEWWKSIFNFPSNSSAMIVSGGSMANLNGLAVARNVKMGVDLRENGIYAQETRGIFYCSDQVHSSVKKSLEFMGLGSVSLRIIETDKNFEIRIDRLKEQIIEDMNNGFQPICVIATAGTTNTGAFDDIKAIHEICEEFDLWLHVDGAFGSLVQLTEKYKHLVSGIELADSIAFDFHKWMFVNYNAGCCLVKNSDDHINTFSNKADYLEHSKRGLAGTDNWLSDFGIELSRDFKALKVWMMMKVYGINRIGRVVEKNIEQAKYLEGLIQDNPDLEMLAPVPINVVCFRYNPGKQINLDELNEEIMLQIQESGFAIISNTRLNEKFALRVSITNHRTKYEDIDQLIEKIISTGNTLI